MRVQEGKQVPWPPEGMTQVLLVPAGQSASRLQGMGCWALMIVGRRARARAVKRCMVDVFLGELRPASILFVA